MIVRAEAHNIDELGQLVVARVQAAGWHHQDPHLPGMPLALLDRRLGAADSSSDSNTGRIAAADDERKRQRRPGRTRLRTALNYESRVEDRASTGQAPSTVWGEARSKSTLTSSLSLRAPKNAE